MRKTLAVRTPRKNVPETVAVKRRRRQKHVGTTLRKNEGVERGFAFGQGSEESTQDLPQGLAMGIFASSDRTRRWKRAGYGLHKHGEEQKECERATGTCVPENRARSRTGWCRVKEHEGTVETTAKDEKLHNSRLQQTQDRGRRGTEASEHVEALTCGEPGTRAGEVGKPRSIQQKSVYRKRDAQYSAESRRRSEALTGALG